MRSFPKQRGCRDDHPVEAVTALRGLFLNEGALHWMVFTFRHQSLQSCDSRATHLGNWKFAGWRRLAPDQHHTGTTGLLATTELRTGKSQFIPQDIKQGCLWFRLDCVRLFIHDENDFI
jgi:hypothetical protein